MFVVYLTVPFMLLAIAVTVVPLVWAMRHHERWDREHSPVAVPAFRSEDRMAA
jgi:hypothetical protein